MLYCDADERQQEEKEVEQENDGRWPCYECSEVFESPSELQRHLAVHDDESAVIGGTAEDDDDEVTHRKHKGRRRRGRPRKIFSDKPAATVKVKVACDCLAATKYLRYSK